MKKIFILISLQQILIGNLYASYIPASGVYEAYDAAILKKKSWGKEIISAVPQNIRELWWDKKGEVDAANNIVDAQKPTIRKKFSLKDARDILGKIEQDIAFVSNLNDEYLYQKYRQYSNDPWRKKKKEIEESFDASFKCLQESELSPSEEKALLESVFHDFVSACKNVHQSAIFYHAALKEHYLAVAK